MQKSVNLFEEDSDSEGENISNVELKTNQEYAKSYNKFRQKELLKKLKDREQDNVESDSSSSDTESSEDESLDPKFDQEFLQTLASLKSKDPKIYDKSTSFFQPVEKDEENLKTKKKKEQPFTLKDYERKVILEHDGKFESEDDEDQDEDKRPVSPTYVEEQKSIKEEIKKAFENGEKSDDEEFGAIFKKRQKTKKELENEEQLYLKWLAGEQTNIGQAGQKLKPLKDYWSDPKLPNREKFLRDYILNNGYMETNTEEVPTYEEIVDEKRISEDEEELEKQAEFEHKYNFRFEEPDKEFIKRYPRTIESSVRKIDDTRKLKRQQVKERKQREKEQKYQELQTLKELKRKEIEEKIQKLKEVTGNDELAFKDVDLEEDFDPDSYDKRMKELFDESYYQTNADEEKPECPDYEDLKVEDWDNYDPNKDEEDDYEGYHGGPHCEDEDFNMDCDYDPNAAKVSTQDELIESTKKRRNRRKRTNKFMEIIKTEKPVFNPDDEKTYADYIDEYYKLDYEDMIGDIPCRFKYVETVPNDFGLTIEEILLAKNKELNQWASLKKAIQIRPEHVERNEAKMYKLKAQNEALKRKIFVSLYGPPSDNEDEPHASDVEHNQADVNEKSPEKKKKRRKRKAPNAVEATEKDSPLTVNHVKQPIPEKLENNAMEKDETLKEIASSELECNAPKKRKKEVTNASDMNTKRPEGEKDKSTQLIVKQTPEKLRNKSLQKDKPIKEAEPNATRKRKNVVTKMKTKKTDETKSNKNVMKKTSGQLKPNLKKKVHITKKPSGSLADKLSDERLKAYGINPKKFRKKQKYGKK